MRTHVRAGLAALLLAAAACTLVQQRAGGGPVNSSASAEKGMLQYQVGSLVFHAPDSWSASGTARRTVVSHPDEKGRIEVEAVDRAFKDEKECLEDGEAALAKGTQRLTNVRRHPSSFGGRRAVTQEADQGAWHGWAWAVCDGASQYRVFFAGRSPIPPDVLQAWRSFTKSASIGARG